MLNICPKYVDLVWFHFALTHVSHFICRKSISIFFAIRLFVVLTESKLCVRFEHGFAHFVMFLVLFEMKRKCEAIERLHWIWLFWDVRFVWRAPNPNVLVGVFYLNFYLISGKSDKLTACQWCGVQITRHQWKMSTNKWRKKTLSTREKRFCL